LWQSSNQSPPVRALVNIHNPTSMGSIGIIENNCDHIPNKPSALAQLDLVEGVGLKIGPEQPILELKQTWRPI
jgi:hypothetical protein